jgi:AcrR family transcriptional regulator
VSAVTTRKPPASRSRKGASPAPAVPAALDGQPAAPRRAPSQQRSRERVELILNVAAALIAEQGSEAMRMGEVAARAGISIGSLYQYFPDKAAIIRELAERYNASCRLLIAAELGKVKTRADLSRIFTALLEGYYQFYLAEPVIRDIWSGAQADRALQDLDLEDNRLNGAVLAAVLAKLHPKADRAALETTAFLVMHLSGAAMRAAIALPRKEGDAAVDAFKRMAVRTLLAG